MHIEKYNEKIENAIDKLPHKIPIKRVFQARRVRIINILRFRLLGDGTHHVDYNTMFSFNKEIISKIMSCCDNMSGEFNVDNAQELSEIKMEIKKLLETEFNKFTKSN